MKNLVLISKKNLPTFPHQSSKKNKTQNLYSWTIERFKEHQTSTLDIDIFPSSPKEKGIQQFKNEFIFELNHRNIFDFDFAPLEKDYLSIFNKKEKESYLNLIFIHGEWEEEYFINSIRDYLDIYIEFESGIFEF